MSLLYWAPDYSLCLGKSSLAIHGERGGCSVFSFVCVCTLSHGWPFAAPCRMGLFSPLHFNHPSLTHTRKLIDQSVSQFSRSVVSDSLRPHESQHARPPCPSPSPWVPIKNNSFKGITRYLYSFHYLIQKSCFTMPFFMCTLRNPQCSNSKSIKISL